MYEKITSTELVIDTCKKLLVEKGFDAINMRSISDACHISLGSLYNYFDSKGSLVYQLTLSIFEEIFTITQEERNQIQSLSDGVRWLYKRFTEGDKKYKFYVSSNSSVFTEAKATNGRRMMDDFLEYIKANLLLALNKDKNVKPGKFSSEERKMHFLEYLLRIIKVSFVNRIDDIDEICYFIDTYLYN